MNKTKILAMVNEASSPAKQQPKQHEPSSLKWEQPEAAHEQSHEQPPRALQVFAVANALPISDRARIKRIACRGGGDSNGEAWVGAH